MPEYDYALVGGGLQSGLVALAVRAAQPAARIVVVERDAELGGNHTWCFHAGDVPDDSAWLAPLVVARWDGYDVRFPGLARTVASAYACVTSARLAACVEGAVDDCLTGVTATSIDGNRVAFAGGELRARCVIDARGPARQDATGAGWQLFLGQELRVSDHGLVRPMLMDATVEQRGGFRFIYVLPLSADRVLVEDTLFANGPALELAEARANIAAYVAARGWTPTELIREETGALPLPLSLDVPAPSAPLVAGYGGGWFHPVTGYSFPVAARLAAAIARGPDAVRALHAQHLAQLPFALRLNRMLFRWFAPAQRHHVFERFYRMPEPTIRRFYALALTSFDRARFFVGRPPRGMSWRAALTGRAVA